MPGSRWTRRMDRLAVCIVMATPGPFARSALAQADGAAASASTAASQLSLEQRVELLTAEVRRLREQMALPETDEQLRGAYGMGPAASKVYRRSAGLSLGGYGEFYFEAPVTQTAATGDVRVADLLRFVSYVGYKFSDRVLMNTEIEFEHATTGEGYDGEPGEVAVEFSYLEFLLHSRLNLRAGNLLLPIGLLNTMHEPAFYHGVLRPQVERTLIPTTWRELGVQAHGTLIDGLRYSAGVVNGLNAGHFSSEGIREGHQEGNRALWEDVAGVLALEYSHHDRLQVGGSFYGGQADQGQEFAGRRLAAWTAVYEAHAQVRHRGFEARALVAGTRIDAAADLTRALYPDSGPSASSQLVPATQWGAYLEAAFDLAPALKLPGPVAVLPWARVEAYDLQASVPSVPLPGDPTTPRSADRSLAARLWTFGLEIKPTPVVVLKADYSHRSNDAHAPESDRLRVGAGFVF
jgi:hypothetical protein